MKLSKPEYKEREPIPDNLYMAKIIKIEAKTSKKGNDYLSWCFELTQPPYINTRTWTWGSTSQAATPKSRLGQWLTVFGVDLQNLESFDTESLLGSYCKIFLKTTVNDEGQEFQNVHELLPLTPVDTQVLQGFLAQAQVTGPQKVAVQSTPAPVVPVVAQPAAPVVAQPVVSAPVAPVVAKPVVGVRRNTMPF